MDVHAPHEPVHNWRDFAIHLAIVTVGLFIALSLEALVEYAHHRHLVAEARENIREELEADHEAAQHDLVLLQKNIEVEKADIQAIHSLQSQGAAFHGSVSNTMDFDSLNDAAWRTARDTGALGYMSYKEVQGYADVYMLLGVVNDAAIATAKQDFLAAAPFEMGIDPDALPAQEYERLLHDNATVEIQLTTLKQIVQEYDTQCLAELKR